MTTAADDGPTSKPLLSDQQRLKLIQSVEKMAYRQVTRSVIPKREWDDAVADCTLHLWQVSAKFDPTGPAKFSTLAHHVIRKVILRYLDANGKHLP